MVQVRVLQARGLRVKGSNGTNDAYAVMRVGKTRVTTSVAERSATPTWTEQATFDLRPPAGSGSEGCSLQVQVMHREPVGPDKTLGYTEVNLLGAREQREWFKLLDKAGKADKERGDVLLDIQFMRNNLSGGMFDLSSSDRSRSRLGKIKDKLRSKKKEGSSDSISAVVPPSFSQVLTDSDEEGVEDAADDTREKKNKKKLKLKTLFSHKSNLQKNMSQSMSVLAPLAERNQVRRSSGLGSISVLEAAPPRVPPTCQTRAKVAVTVLLSPAAMRTTRSPMSPKSPRHGAAPAPAPPSACPAPVVAPWKTSTSCEVRGGSTDGSFSSYDSLRVPKQQSSPWAGSKATEEEGKEEE
ncbi:hypothetical protein CRUP_013172, partial [Coryphaenoides rupestris]